MPHLVSENLGAYGNYEYRLRTNLFVEATFSGVVLPVSEEYEGARVLIMDGHFIKTRTATPPTTIRAEDGSKIISGLFLQTPTSMNFEADMLEIDSGVIELVLLNRCERDESTGDVDSYSLQWVLIGNSCQHLAWRDGEAYLEYKYNLY